MQRDNFFINIFFIYFITFKKRLESEASYVCSKYAWRSNKEVIAVNALLRSWRHAVLTCKWISAAVIFSITSPLIHLLMLQIVGGKHPPPEKYLEREREGNEFYLRQISGDMWIVLCGAYFCPAWRKLIYGNICPITEQYWLL